LPDAAAAWPDGVVIWLRTRSEWRQRGLALCSLTLLVALAGAMVLTAAAGSRRTRSSIDRAARITHNADFYAVLGSNTSLAGVSTIARLPQVAVGRRVALMGLFTTKGYAVAGSPIDPGIGSDLLGYRVLRGRAAHPDAADEIALSETTAAAFNLDVGGTFDLASPSFAQWACLDQSAPVAGSALCKTTLLALNRDRLDLSQLQGPHVRLRVVGVTRNLFEVGAASNVVFFNFLTPAFFTKYRAIMQWQPTVMVRYRPGVTDAQFEAAVTRAVPRDAITDTGTFTSVLDALRSTAGVLANGLLVFALVAALVGLVLISQVLARYTDRGTNDREVLRVFGATRAARVVDACAPLVPVAIAGALLSVFAAWIASGWMPIGTARRAEFARGRDFDAVILIGGALVIVAVVLVTSAAAALWIGHTHARGTTRGPLVTHRVLLGGVITTTAASMVTEVGRGRRAIPLRSAVAGTALAMAGVIGVAVFSGSLTRLTTDPARQGWGWDVIVRGNTAAAADGKPANAAPLVADPDVSAVTQVWIDYEPKLNGHTIPGFAQRFVKGNRGCVIVRGRPPAASDEVAVGAKSLRRAGVALGGSVDIEGKSFRVVGTALFPATTSNYALADGVLFTEAGIRRAKLVATGGDDPQFVVTFRPGVDRAVAMQRLKVLNNGDLPGGPVVHAEIEQLRQLDRLPSVLAGFLVVVALLAVGNLIVLSVRRRGHDLAVVRALGCTPRQVDRIVALQATLLALAGVVVGVPAGIIFGQLVWARVADAYGVADDAAWPWVAIAVAVAGTLVLVNAIAWLPARRAAQKPVAQALMTE
jgi:hypothetical protein